MAVRWVSDTEVRFRAPCERTVPQTAWPKKGDTYRGVYIVNPNGDASPTQSDVKFGHLPIEDQAMALVYVTDKCVEEGTILLNGRCNPCPTGAECPGGGRVRLFDFSFSFLCFQSFAWP